MTPIDKPLFSFSEKIMFGCVAFLLILIVFFLSRTPGTRYRLPNGDIVECAKMVETSKGNFHLTDCQGGSEYYVQGTVEVLK